MKSNTLAKTAVSVVIFAGICSLAALSEPHVTGDMQAAPWYSIVPPLLTIVLAFLTRNILLSIAIAIITGGLLTTLPADPVSLNAILTGLSRKAYRRLARTLATQTGMTNAWLADQGLISVRDLWISFHYPNGYADR